MSKEEIDKKDIFMDKIKLAAYYISKEDYLISLYSELISFIREQACQDVTIVSEQNEWINFWKTLLQIYDMTKNDYMEKLDDTKKDKIKEIMEKYSNSIAPMGIHEATEAKEIILEIMSYTGFHDVMRKAQDEASFESEED